MCVRREGEGGGGRRGEGGGEWCGQIVTRRSLSISAHACTQLKTDQRQCTSPFGWTDEPKPTTPVACGSRFQASPVVCVGECGCGCVGVCGCVERRGEVGWGGSGGGVVVVCGAHADDVCLSIRQRCACTESGCQVTWE